MIVFSLLYASEFNGKDKKKIFIFNGFHNDLFVFFYDFYCISCW